MSRIFYANKVIGFLQLQKEDIIQLEHGQVHIYEMTGEITDKEESEPDGKD